MKNFLLLFFTFLSINTIYSQADCANTSPICSGNIAPQPSLVGPNLGSPGCLGSAPNGNWYTFQVGFAGDLIFNLHQGNNAPLFNNLDIDFICWGPFTDAQMATACNNLSDLTAPANPSNIIDCSYSADAVETITIPNANPGSNYILLITNFSGQPGQFVMEQTNVSAPGSGTTNCDVVCGVDLGPTSTSVYPSPPDINTVSICDPAITSQTLHCNFENPPANQATLAYKWYLDGVLQPGLTTKSITVTQSGTWKVVVTHPDCGSPSEDSVIVYFGGTPVLTAPPTQVGPVGDCNPTFDLTALIPAILAPLSPADYTVTFYTDLGASIIYDYPVTGHITNPSAFSTNVDTIIYVRARNNTSPECIDSDDISFLLDVICDPTATGNTICPGNLGQLSFSGGSPGMVITFTEGPANTIIHTVTLGAAGTAVWTTPLPLVTTTIYTLTNAAVGSPTVNTPLNSTATITVLSTISSASAPSATPTLCVNTPLIPTVTHTTTGATGIGTATNLPPGLTASWAGDLITISGTPTATGIFNYAIPLTGGCGMATATGTITVSPNNTVTAASSTPTLCVNTLLTPITHSTTGATGIGTATDLPAGVTATWTPDTITISGTPTVSGVFNYTIPLTGGCGTVNATGTITVTPNNTVTVASLTPTLCVNTMVLTPITHTTTGATGIGAATGLPAGITASWTAPDTIAISGTPTATGVFNYDIPLTGGCGIVSATGTITVISNNTVSAASTTPTLCVNTPLTPITHATTGATGIGTATGLPNGVTASWSADSIVITGTPTVSGTFTYDIPLTGGCGAFNATGTITVTPDNTVAAASLTPTLCINTLLPTITHATTGATGIGTATGLPSGVIATWIAPDTIQISGTPTVSGTFTYTIPLTGGCGTFSATGTITVKPNNTVTAASATPTLCVNTLLTPFTHTTTGATGIGTATGLPAGVTATWIAPDTIEISGTPTAAGTFNYDIPLTGGCGAFSATGTITVNPDNTVTAASYSPTLCVNSALTPSIFHTTTGATGIGAATGLPAGVTALWSGNEIIISGTPSAIGTFTYTIPLTGGCGGVATGTITVTPENTVTLAATATLCVNTALALPITHLTTGATGIGAATGLPAGVTASWSGNEITISGTPSVTGTFNYDIPLTGGCGTVSATGTITVNPDNTVTAASATPTLCINTPLTPFTHTTTGATGIGAATGLPAGVTASWLGNTITISGTPTTAGTFNYTIPLTGGCGIFNATGTIIVIPSNTVTAASSTPAISCVDAPLNPITHTTTGATGIGTPTNLPAGVSASWVGDTITITGTPSVIGTFNYTIPLTGGCGTVNATGTIIVNPIPAGMAISGGTTICAGGTANLTVTATAGTIITWTATPGTSSSFTIGALGSNTIPVSPAVNTTYTLTTADLNGCVIPIVGESATVNVSVTPQFITQIPDITICDGEQLNIASQLTSTVPGTTFNWNASYSNTIGKNNLGEEIIFGDENNIDLFVSLVDNLQVGIITLQIIPRIGTCSGDSQEILINVNPIPQINSVDVVDTEICNNEFVTITASSTPVATVYNWQINTASNVQIVGGAPSGSSTTGVVTLQLALINPSEDGTISFDFTPVKGSCIGDTATTVTINVNQIPGTPIGLPDAEICSGESTNLIISSSPNVPGTMLEWTVIDSQNVTGFTNGSGLAPFAIDDVLTNTSNVQGFVTYSVTSKLGDCEGGTTEYTVFVNPLPIPNLVNGHVCVNQTTNVTYQSYILDAQLSDPNFTYDWYVLNTTTGLYDALPSTHESTYEVTIPGTYQVIVTNTVTNCQSDPDEGIATVITVYPATDFTYVVTDAFTNNATITVTVNPIGTGNLIYSLDGGAWQSSNVFTGVEAGPHEIMVEDTEGCTNLTQSITVIDYPKYFTPNGDGFNDKWKIVGLEAKHNAKIYIFDRYGKLIKQIDPLGDGWDGKYNGQDITSTDYWFNVDYIENNQEKQFKAHFSLKR